MKVLVVDKAGTPRNWEDVQTGACYYARDKVLAEFGSPIKTFIGGKNEHGEISEITVSSIISVSGPIFGKILELRRLNTIINNYIPNWKPQEDGRVRTTWGFKAASGQLDSSRPNVLNISKHTELVRLVILFP